MAKTPTAMCCTIEESLLSTKKQQPQATGGARRLALLWEHARLQRNVVAQDPSYKVQEQGPATREGEAAGASCPSGFLGGRQGEMA